MLSKYKKRGVSLIDTSFTDIIIKIIYLVIISSVIIFILWPMLEVFLKSIYPDGNLCFSIYKNLFTENRQLLINSIFVSVSSTFIAIFLGLCIALYVIYSAKKDKKIIMGTLVLTMISPPFVSSMVYIMLFGRRGLITDQLLNLNINPYGWQGIIIVQGLGHTSLAALILIGVLQGIDANLENASRDSGAGCLQTLKNIIIPLAVPGILAAFLISFIKSLSDFGTPIIIGGNFNVLATEAYLNVIGLYNLPVAAAMSILLLVPALLVFIFYRKIMSNSDFFSLHNGGSSNDRMFLSKKTKLFLRTVTWIFIIIMFIKYFTIFWGAFAKTWGVDFTLSLRHIRKFNYRKLDSFFRSLKYALIAGVLGSFIGLLLSYILARKSFVGNQIIDFISNLPYMIPGTFFGIGYLMAFNSPPLKLTGTAFIIIVNCIFRQLPIGTRAGISVLSQLNPELEDSARGLGANDFYVVKDIVFPNLKPAFLISFINTFTTTMITIGAIIFLVTPGSKVATVELFDAIKEGNIGLGAVFANLIIITVLAVNVLFIWFFQRKKDEDWGDEIVSTIKKID